MGPTVLIAGSEPAILVSKVARCWLCVVTSNSSATEPSGSPVVYRMKKVTVSPDAGVPALSAFSVTSASNAFAENVTASLTALDPEVTDLLVADDHSTCCVFLDTAKLYIPYSLNILFTPLSHWTVMSPPLGVMLLKST